MVCAILAIVLVSCSKRERGRFRRQGARDGPQSIFKGLGRAGGVELWRARNGVYVRHRMWLQIIEVLVCGMMFAKAGFMPKKKD